MNEPDAGHHRSGVERASAPASRHAPSSDELLLHAGALYRLAHELTRSRDEAEDLVQEAYERAVRAIGRFEPGSNLRAWLFRILRNAWIDTGRSAARHAPDAGAGEELPDDAAAQPDRAVLRGDDELERLRGVVSGEIGEALRGLGHDARTVVLLDLEGFTETEIADVMGCAVGTVKSRLHRARSALRERLAEYRR